MRSTLLLPAQSLISPQSVQLGRFVRNAQNPHQDYFYPSNDGEDPPKIIVKTLQNFQEIITSYRSPGLISHLKLSPIGAIATTAEESRIYLLDNSSEWFRRACKTPATRQWILEAIKDGARMYLTVGYHAIVDARVYEKRGELVSRQAQAAQEGSNSLVATLDSSNSHERSFGAPGEQIYAVQYRKLRFNWFSSRHVDKAELERDNRWKVSLGLRGGDNRNVDDVLEAYLADGMEAKGGERVVSSDGMEEFIFDWNEEDEDEDEDEVMPWD